MDALDTGSPSGPAELRAFLDSLPSAWAETVEGEDAVMVRFNSYVPMWTVRTLMGRPVPS